MAYSLSSECTPLKHAYDSCFNAWFAGYLEPTLTPHQQREKDKNPQEYQRQKAEEYQRKCGKVWESYKECVQVGAHTCVTFRTPYLMRTVMDILSFTPVF